jgi:hypothetical protein
MFAIDWMLFGSNLLAPGFGCVASVPVAFVLTIPSILIQKHQFHDGWGAAVGKGLMVGLLTVIPTALPSVVSLTGGALGAASLLMPDGARPDQRLIGE